MPLAEIDNTEILGIKRAAHLLRRCTFNVTPKRIRDFAALTAQEAVEYLFDFDAKSTNTPKGLSPNPGLMFPYGPLWYQDGAPMHPPGYGAGQVNYVGTRNYVPSCHDKIFYLTYDGKIQDGLSYQFSGNDIAINYTLQEVNIGISATWNSANNHYDISVVENPIGNLNLDSSKFFIHFIKAKNQYLTATYIQSGVYSWRMYEAIQDTSIRWKLVFWINSLFTTASERLHYHYPHWKLMYDFVNGLDITNAYSKEDNYTNSLKALAFAMCYSNEMLLYLDNNRNTKNGPNENYAREFLELFTILKDPSSPEQGNYINFTEQDVVEAAKVFTGFIDERMLFDSVAGKPWGKKVLAYHDKTDKVFSKAFGEYTVMGRSTLEGMDEELWDFINMVFDQDINVPNTSNPNIKPTAQSYIKKMYRYFVSDKIDESVEVNIISVLAKDLYKTDQTQKVNFLYKDVLKNLLKSKHFYEDENTDGISPCNSLIGSKIKSPLELLLTTINLFEIRNEDLDILVDRYKNYQNYNLADSFSALDAQGFYKNDRELQFVHVLFGSAACEVLDLKGPYPSVGPDLEIPEDYIQIDFAKAGNDYNDLVTSNILTKGQIRNVFHGYMFRQFGVPLQLCGFNLNGPDTVEGYRGYYKEPGYSKNWLDSNNFYNRYSFGRSLLDGFARFKGFDQQYEDVAIQYKANLVEWVKNNIDYSSPTLPNAQATNNEDCFINSENTGPATIANTVVYEILTYLLAAPPSIGSERFLYFKNIFLGDLSDYAWRVIWICYIYDEVGNRDEAEIPLYNLCRAITESHEFQTF